jgi:acyl-CoA synthetase (AMP-forming)/AMP-acid ligase II
MLERARGTQDLASLRFAFAGAEKCPDHVYGAFSLQCPDAALCEGYGITECSPIVSVNRPENITPGSIGHALASVDAAVVREEDGRILGRANTDETGMLLVRGPSIFGGYLGEAPSPFVEFENTTWYRTGDLISRDATGRFFFRGRLKRFVKIGGEMISLPQIEEALLSACAHREDAPAEGPALAVEATPEESGPEIVLFTPMRLSVREANDAIRAAGLSTIYSVRRVMRVAAIPLLGSGKTDYRKLKELLKNAAL